MATEDLASRQAGLSAAKRALLERWKRGDAADPAAPAPAAAPAAAPGGAVIPRRAGGGPAPLAPAQQRFWFLDQLTPANPAYNLQALSRLHGPLDRGALAHALGAVLRRHEALRTVLRGSEGEAAQVVLQEIGLALPTVDLAGLPAARREAAAAAAAGQAAGRGFDLGRPPLVRALLLASGGGDNRLLLVLHHVIADGWSMGVLLHDLAACYEARAHSGPGAAPPALPALPLQYADFAVWQRRRLAAGAFAADLAHWRRQLAGAPESVDLPTDRPRPPAQSLRGRELPVACEAAVTAALAALARRQGATPFMALLAVFAGLLSRYSGQTDLLLGTPVAGRTRPELAGLVGLFVNTVVLRSDLAGDPTWNELVERTRRAALAAFDHQELPFDSLVEELRPGRDLGRNPLFQVMFALQNTPLPEIALRRLTLRQEELESRTAMLDLALSLRERGGVMAGALRYATDLFDAATAARLAVHFQRLAAAAAAAPQRRLSELPLLDAAERTQLLAWNDTTAPLGRPSHVHQRVAAWAAAVPDQPAVVCAGEVVSHGELDRRANHLARRLRRLGVGPEVRVGLCAGRSATLVVGILGILKAGGTYLPLDDGYPPERLALMLADSGAPVLLTVGARAAALAAALVPAAERPAGGRPRLPVTLRLDAGWGEVAGEVGGPLPEPDGDLTGASLAYVIYTSGSTGRPKGVGCTHLGLANLVAGIERHRPLPPGTACSLWTSISFDVSVSEVFGTLCCGGVLHVPTEEERVSADTLLPWLARHQVWSADLPAFMLADLAAWVRGGEPERRLLGCLWVGVEPIREGLLAEIQAAVPGLRILNGYGPTEATVCDTLFEVGSAGPEAQRRGERRTPLGKPIANCRIHVVDPHGELVPVGVPGEMWIAGTVLARGYLGRPEQTAERFVPDPIGGPGVAPGGRCYRTGDLARRLPSGDLEFLGRRDQQVKLRGFRIELEEVEAVLASHPTVREAAAAVRTDGRGEQHLVAYVVARAVDAGDGDGVAARVAAWREHLAARLPAHMVPTAFVPLPALPLTPSAKLDRRALPEPDWEAGALAFVAPCGDVEPRLAEIWSELLGGGPISAADDFFARGGHSLLGTRLVARVRERFAVELPLRALFEDRTVAALAQRIARLRREGGGGPAAPGLGARRRGGPLPLSYSQQRLWFMDQLDPGSILFNTPGGLRLRGRLGVALLGRVLGEVVRRHEVLRTTYEAVDGRPVQVIAAAMPQALPVADLTALPAARREAELARRVAAEVGRPFDLARGPLLRTTLLRLGPQEHVLLVNMHHIAGDRWSQAVVRRELAVLYDAWSNGQPSPRPAGRALRGMPQGHPGRAAAANGGSGGLPELPLQYADYALWQRQWLAGEVLDAHVAACRRLLAGAPQVLALPADRPRPLTQSFRGGVRPLVLPAGLVAGLTGWAQQRSATLFMTLLAALGTLLGRAAGQEDLLIGSPVAGRERPQLEGLIGNFVNTLVLRIDLAGDPAFAQLLDRVRTMALDAFAHQALPFERLVDELAPVRDLGRSPLFQAGFALQNVPTAPLRLGELEIAPLGVESGTSQQDLALMLADREGALAGFWEFARDLFDGATVERLSHHFQTLLGAVAAEPGRRISELPLLSAAETQQLRHEWNDTAAALPAGARIEQLFAALAAAQPAAPAVSGDGETWTYGRLRAAAGRLAGHLRALGVGAETRVAVALERSAALVVALLGILEAGAVYVPLDPGYPDERLALMLADSAAPLVLVHQRTRARMAALSGGQGGAANGSQGGALSGDLGHAPGGAAGGALSGAEGGVPGGAANAAAGAARASVQASSPATADGSEAAAAPSLWRLVSLEELPGVLDTAAPAGEPRDTLDAAALLAGPAGPAAAAGPLGLAYIAYTSGSTGRPKGVAVPHQGVIRLVRGTNHVHLGAADRVVFCSNVSFDAATFEIWGTLLNGGTLVVMSKDEALQPAEMASRLRQERVTVLHLTTALFNQMVREEPAAMAPRRYLLTGGEAADASAMAAALRLGGTHRLLHTYGPTESTTFATWHNVDEVEPGAAPVPIGRPLANTTVFVVDRWAQAAALGQLGELWIGGLGLARGYLNLPALTAERFVPHPWSAAPGERLYRTGDLVRCRRDGAIEFMGRIDQQVKIRGFRIEPGEIEAALAEHAGIAACAVTVRDDGPGGRRLVAYLAPRAGVAPEAAELRTFLAAKLPPFMIPAAFVAIPALPLTPHGKVDRAALPAPLPPAATAQAVAPRTAAEITLAAIWAQVLGRPEVGVHDNFFELGGDSILGVQIVARARRAGLRLTTRDLFEHQTVAELGAVADAAGGAAGAPQAGAEIPLTPIQRAFFADELAEPHHFNQSLLLDLLRPLAPTRLAAALDRLATRHEALRLRFRRAAPVPSQAAVAERAPRGAAGWTQVLAGPPAVPLAHLDLAAVPAPRRRAALIAAAAALQGSLELERGPLLRAALFTLGGGGGKLLLVAHHLIVDAVSWRILLADLEAACGAPSAVPALPPPGTSLAQWGAALGRQARSAAAAAELAHWLKLADARVPPLPVDHPGGANTVASARAVVLELPAAETTALLEEVAAAWRVRAGDLLLAGLAEALTGWTGAARLLIDIEGHGREELFDGCDLTQTVGWFTSVHPVLLTIDRRGRDAGERLQAIREQLWAVPHGGFGFGLLRHPGPEDSASAAAAERLRELPAAEVLFNYLGELDRAQAPSLLFARAAEPPGPQRSARQRRAHLFEIDGGILGGRLRLTWTYSASLHERHTIEALGERWLAALRELTAAAGGRRHAGAARTFTPADFGAKLSQKDLDKVIARIGGRRTP